MEIPWTSETFDDRTGSNNSNYEIPDPHHAFGDYGALLLRMAMCCLSLLTKNNLLRAAVARGSIKDHIDRINDELNGLDIGVHNYIERFRVRARRIN